jgi:hypothetical protein
MNERQWPSTFVDGRQPGFERGVEAVTIECLEEPIALHLVLQPAAHLHECHMRARTVQLAVELLQHLSRGDVDIGYGFALHDHPRRVTVSGDPADLIPKGGAIGEEKRGLPPVYGDPRELARFVVLPLRNTRRTATTPLRPPASSRAETVPGRLSVRRRPSLRRVRSGRGPPR